MESINWLAWSGILVDLVIVSILVSHIFWGYRRGLINIAFKVLSFFVAIIIMLVLYKPVANLIMDKTQLDEHLTESIASNLSGTTLKDGQLLNVDGTNIASSFVEQINKFVTEAINKGITNTIEYVSANVARMMIYVGTMLGLFIIARILLFFVRFLAELIGNLPIIKSFNKSGGLIFGLIKGFLVVYIILGVLSILSPVIRDLGIISAIHNSHLGSLMYNNNLLLNILYSNFN
jgi:uncharacterized membrane protein required for colicin V production